MQQRYIDIAAILRENRRTARGLEARISVDNVARDLGSLFLEADHRFPIARFQEASGLYLPLLSDTLEDR